jgi:hypothetical protein
MDPKVCSPVVTCKQVTNVLSKVDEYGGRVFYELSINFGNRLGSYSACLCNISCIRTDWYNRLISIYMQTRLIGSGCATVYIYMTYKNPLVRPKALGPKSV